VKDSSQEAFSQLVQRHLQFVYSICRREVGDAALAEDVTQAVFIILSRKADGIRNGTTLTGWLFNTARFACRNAMRQESRRRAAEEEVIAEMTHRAGEEDSAEATWHEIEPLLHDGIAALGAKDREAVLLRYFENKSFKEVGRLLGLSENTAQQRVIRAIEKLRGYLKKHGVAVPSVVLAALLLERTVQAVPATCAAAVAGVISKVGITTAGAVSIGLTGSKAAAISQGVIKAMFMNQIKVAAMIAGLGLAGAGGGLLVRHQAHSAQRANVITAGSSDPARQGENIAAQQNAELKKKEEETRPARLAKIKWLREKWQTWALQHKDILQRMLKAQPNDLAAFQAVYNAIPTSPTVDTAGFTAKDLGFSRSADIFFTWNLVEKGKTEKDVPERMRKMFKSSLERSRAGEQKDWVEFRDIEISRSNGSSFSLWASGRITKNTEEEKHVLVEHKGKKVMAYLFEQKRMEILPPYDFLK